MTYHDIINSKQGCVSVRARQSTEINTSFMTINQVFSILDPVRGDGIETKNKYVGGSGKK